MSSPSLGPKLLFLAVTALLLGGCVDQISTDLPAPPKRLVVNAILNPDSIFRVQVSRVSSATDASVRLLPAAQVSLATPGRRTEVLLDRGNGYYDISAKPASGVGYTIQVAASNYPTVSATDTVPAPVSIREAWYSYPTATDRNNEKLGTIVVRFDDPGATANYYEVDCYQSSQGLPDRGNGIPLDARGNAAIVAEDDSEFNPPSLFFSDKLFNGGSFELRASFKPNSAGASSGIPTVAPYLYLTLRSVSKTYYQYRKSLTRHLYNQGVKDEGYGYNVTQLLFLGDPTTLYSNVDAGYGVVASFAKQTIVLPLR